MVDQYISGGIIRSDFYLNEMSARSGFIEIEGIEGCENWREIDANNMKYDEHTRFIKTLCLFVDYDLSNYERNYICMKEDTPFPILVKLAPYATKLYNIYSHNINEYSRFYPDTIKLLGEQKRLYLTHVFENEKSNEYDKMFAINVVLHEFVMWSEYEEYEKYTRIPYFIEFFETHRQYIVNLNDWKRWNRS